MAPLPPTAIPKEELKTAEMHDLSHERDARCVPLAHELIKMLAEQSKMPVGSHVNEKEGEVEDYYRPTVVAFMKRLITEEVKVMEVVYIFQLARQALEAVESVIDETMNRNMNRNTEAMYGLKDNDYDEVTVKQLNTVALRHDKIKEMWTPILETPVDGEEA